MTRQIRTDVAQARDFFHAGTTLNGILPDAVEQGRIAGMAMAGDAGAKPYAGGVPLNNGGSKEKEAKKDMDQCIIYFHHQI